MSQHERGNSESNTENDPFRGNSHQIRDKKLAHEMALVEKDDVDRRLAIINEYGRSLSEEQYKRVIKHFELAGNEKAERARNLYEQATKIADELIADTLIFGRKEFNTAGIEDVELVDAVLRALHDKTSPTDDDALLLLKPQESLKKAEDKAVLFEQMPRKISIKWNYLGGDIVILELVD